MLKRLKAWYRNLPGFRRGLLTAVGVLLLVPLVVMALKTLLGLAIVGGMLLLQTREERIGPEHYRYMCGVIEGWNRHASPATSGRACWGTARLLSAALSP